MKKKLFLIGTLPVALLAATVVINSGDAPEGAYEARPITNISDASQSAMGMFQVYHELRGDFTKEDYMRVWNDVQKVPVNRSSLSWSDYGPDNIGGRTRAILVDKDNINLVYAGSVSGGLFKSINRANLWSPVPEFNANLAVSSMCQTVDGTLIIATGHEAEQSNGSFSSGAYGEGVYRSNTDGTFSVIAGTENYQWINEVVSDTLNNVAWIACESGLKKYDVATQTLTSVTNGLSTGAVSALDISPDGQLIVCCRGGNKTWVSNDAGATFIDYSSLANTPNPISPSGVSRTEYSISSEKDENGKYHLYASQAAGFLAGIWHSSDNGINWTRIAPANNQVPGAFAPFESGGQGQGNYDNIIKAVKGNPKKVILGGIDTYSWSTTGNWSQLSNWFLPPQSPLYVHADVHELYWDKKGRLYIGSDGGINISENGGQTFYPANRGYNITQFYNIGASGHGDVIGGTQDNGSLANYHDNSTWQEFDEVGGGDGFSSEIAFTNRNILLSSVYYSQVRRSADRGANSTYFVPTEIVDGSSGCVLGSLNSGETCGSFFTRFKLWENPKDFASTDSINYVPTQAYSVGDTVMVPSKTTQMFIEYITPISVEFSDTVYYSPGLTSLDTIVTSLQGFTYNMNLLNYVYISGSPVVSVGDSMVFSGTDTIEVASINTVNHYYGTNLGATKTVNMGFDTVLYKVAWDTLQVQDHYQSWFVLGLGGADGLWMTRNALRFSAPGNEWFNVANISGTVTALEFSQDGDYLWIGTSGGQLYRFTGFNDVYSPKKDYGNDVMDAGFYGDTLIDITTGGTVQTTLTQMTGTLGGIVTDIAVSDDNDHIVATVGGFSTGNKKVKECTNATTATSLTSDFDDITGTGASALPSGLPVYCAIIQKDNPNTVIVGTEMGVFMTTNAGIGADWENVSGAFGNVPVFDMQQNWRDFNDGCNRPGEIYIGTHGRGIWASADFLSLPSDQDNLTAHKFIPNINVYPNPMNDFGNVGFNLENSSDVTIQIFNLSGQMVTEIKEGNMPAGENKISFGATELAKGTYIIRLNAGDRVETSKFIKR